MDERNVILIGLSGSGKTTVGEALAKRLGWTFADTDHMIEAAAGQPVSEIFRDFGEPEFRRRETEAVKAVTAMKRTVVSTGGGVVLNPDNVQMLRGCGWLVHLDRHPDSILNGLDVSNRPLLKRDPEALIQMAQQREPLYAEARDLRLSNDEDCGSAVDELALRIETGCIPSRVMVVCVGYSNQPDSIHATENLQDPMRELESSFGLKAVFRSGVRPGELEGVLREAEKICEAVIVYPESDAVAEALKNITGPDHIPIFHAGSNSQPIGATVSENTAAFCRSLLEVLKTV